MNFINSDSIIDPQTVQASLSVISHGEGYPEVVRSVVWAIKHSKALYPSMK